MGIIAYPFDELRKRAANIDRLREEGWRQHQTNFSALLGDYVQLPTEQNAMQRWLFCLSGGNGGVWWTPTGIGEGLADLILNQFESDWNAFINEQYNTFYRHLAQSLRDAADEMQRTEQANAQGFTSSSN